MHQTNCSRLVQNERTYAIDENRSSFESLSNYFHSRDKICNILLKEYGSNTLKSCKGSCRACRETGRRFAEIYPLEPEDDHITKSAVKKTYIVQSQHTFGHNTINQK